MDINASLQITDYSVITITVGFLFIFDWKKGLSVKILQWVAGILSAYLVSMAILKSILQYSLWASNPATKAFLPPIDPSYFYFYSYHRFFLPAIVAIAAAFFFGVVLYMLTHYSESRWVSKKEIWLAAVSALLVGWPSAVLLAVITFAVMVVLGISHYILPKFIPERTKFAPCLFFSLMVVLVFGNFLIDKLGLTVMKI